MHEYRSLTDISFSMEPSSIFTQERVRIDGSVKNETRHKSLNGMVHKVTQISEEVMAILEGLETEDPDCLITVTGGIDRPPYDKFHGIAALFEHAKKVAAEIGFELEDLKTGGGSDGNFTGALGIPTLDGLGADGHGAHSFSEYIFFSSLEERTRLMIGLMETLE